MWLLILTVPVLVLASSLPGKNLTLLQEIDPSNHELLDIESSKDLAIIAGGLGGTAIYDISNPKNPDELGQMTLPGCEHGRAYKIINVDDPENPKLLGEAPIDGHAKNLAYHENKVNNDINE